MNLTFYPGPSKLYPSVEKHLTEAYRSGILSMNHRSGAFMDMLAQTIAELRKKQSIPTDYEVYFTSSATECWEIIAQSLTEQGSLHVYNGAFGQKWYEYSQRLLPTCKALPFGMNQDLSGVESDLYDQAELLCLTHSETSNGTRLTDQNLRMLRQKFGGIVAVDATSSMGGVELPWTAADVWFASVQKCFGLPPGLGIMVVSPAAIQKAERKADRAFYNSLLFVRENFLKNQTPYTPNTLSIYLLGKVMQEVAPIEQVGAHIRDRAQAWYEFLTSHSLDCLVENPAVRSDTVIALRGEAHEVQALKAKALAQGILLGNGYGEWKGISVRMANFPALSDDDVQRVQEFLQNNISLFQRVGTQ